MRTLKGFLKAVVLLGLFAALFFFRDEATNFFLSIRGSAQGLVHSVDYRAFTALETENASLKQELAKRAAPAPKAPANLLAAHVYSRYPFNDKNLIVIDKGSADGVTEGMPVLAANNLLLGRVRSVSRMQSEVITIFDPLWKTSASLGKAHVKTVLQGANTPRAELIPKDATITIGDAVVNSAKEYPLGLLVGTVHDVTQDEKKVWQIATLDVPYAIEDLDTVFVMTNFK